LGGIKDQLSQKPEINVFWEVSMKKLNAFSVAVVILLVAIPLAGQSESATQDNDFATTVKNIHDQYVERLLASDTEAWLSLWDENGVLMVDEAIMAEGKENIRTTMDGVFRACRYVVFEIQISKTYTNNNIGFAFGNWHYIYQYKSSGAKIYRYGKYVHIFQKKADGTWRIYLECYNKNAF
jgi:ketosteroid isomerase-like protein